MNEWRTPNSIVLRLYGRGEVFYAYVEYATQRWRAGGDSPGGFATLIDSKTGKPQLKGFASGTVHSWSLKYDPNGNDGNGTITAKIDGETAICNLDAGHKQDGATFNRFGILNIPKHFDQGGETWFDDIIVNGEPEHFDSDPRWEAVRTPATFQTTSVRPRFDFGYSATNFAGGKAPGEVGGEIFRGDARYPERIAYYGDRLNNLTLDKPLRASGRVAMRRGISDSTTLVGFFNSKTSVAVSSSPTTGFPIDFLGVAIEGPSREGFCFYPAYHFADGTLEYARDSALPHILPNGTSHEWLLEYAPPQNGSAGNSAPNSKTMAARSPSRNCRDLTSTFDRFGIVTTWIDGNSQHVYVDDLTYTFRQ